MKIKISKTALMVIGFVLLAFTLRTIISFNLNIGADETIYAVRGIDIISANRLSTMDQGPIYYYIMDIGYKIFGVSAFSSRLPGVLFGSMAVILVFLIGSEFFNKRKALIASTLFAISGYAIRAITELDMLMTFFILLSIYFYIDRKSVV